MIESPTRKTNKKKETNIIHVTSLLLTVNDDKMV